MSVTQRFIDIIRDLLTEEVGLPNGLFAQPTTNYQVMEFVEARRGTSYNNCDLSLDVVAQVTCELTRANLLTCLRKKPSIYIQRRTTP